MMYEIYRGRFYSRENVRWDVSLLRDQDVAEATVGVLTFPYREPLLIEWPVKGKEEVLCGSQATLTVISPGDRTYTDLYSVEVGSVRLDVWREGRLYWSGTLDPEFYEEPYSTLEDYAVSLTFSDLGILERQRFTLTGLVTLRELVGHAALRSGLNFVAIDERHISTRLPGSARSMQLSDLSVRSDNFYDEDGEALTLAEAVTGVLQPLGLRLVQKDGRLWVYDLNGLYEGCGVEKVEWQSDDQVLGCDVVYNNAKITWSPYVESGSLTQDTCYVDDTDPNLTSLGVLTGKEHQSSTYYSYHYSGDPSEWDDATDSGFTLWTSPEGKNAVLCDAQARFFKIVAQEDGEACEGVALCWPSVGHIESGVKPDSGADFVMHGLIYSGNAWRRAGAVLWKSADVWLAPVSSSGELDLRVTLKMLMDCRFNPFEGASEHILVYEGVTEKDLSAEWDEKGNFVYVPVTLKWQPDGSDDVYVWTNQDVVRRSLRAPVTSLGSTRGEWVKYDMGHDDAPLVYGWLCWYSGDDRDAKCGVQGWKSNRPAINPHTSRLSAALSGFGDGQPVPYPSVGTRGGRVWLEVRGGWMVCDGGHELKTTDWAGENSMDHWMFNYEYVWALQQLPEVTVIHARQYDMELDDDDVEYSGVLNAAAKESLEIDTICGSASGGIAGARGAYRLTQGLTQVKQLVRAGRTATAEELLIGTLYSQYATRRTKLEGTARLGSCALTLWRDAMQDGVKFLETGSVEDMQDDSSQRVLVELRPDEYDRKK